MNFNPLNPNEQHCSLKIVHCKINIPKFTSTIFLMNKIVHCNEQNMNNFVHILFIAIKLNCLDFDFFLMRYKICVLVTVTYLYFCDFPKSHKVTKTVFVTFQK